MEKAAEPVFVRTREQSDEREFDNELTITDAGRDVLRGKRDWLSMLPPERWVGGGCSGWGVVPGLRWAGRHGVNP